MYAITQKGFRAIESESDLAPGETLAAEIPGWLLLESEKEQARATRGMLLRSSDWTQIPDNNLSAQERAEWAAYRAALRDIPEHPSFPNMPWPVAPSLRSGAGSETGEQS